MYDGALQDLIDALSRLPGIGPKSAQRIAFYVLSRPKAEAKLLAQALVDAKEKKNVYKRQGYSGEPG